MSIECWKNIWARPRLRSQQKSLSEITEVTISRLWQASSPEVRIDLPLILKDLIGCRIWLVGTHHETKIATRSPFLAQAERSHQGIDRYLIQALL